MLLKWLEAQKKINDGVVFLTFKTMWCNDCKMMELMLKPIFEYLKKNNFQFEVIDVDAEEANIFRTSNEWNVLKVPSFYLIKNGQKKHLGYEFIPVDLIKQEIIDANENNA